MFLEREAVGSSPATPTNANKTGQQTSYFISIEQEEVVSSNLAAAVACRIV